MKTPNSRSTHTNPRTQSAIGRHQNVLAGPQKWSPPPSCLLRLLLSSLLAAAGASCLQVASAHNPNSSSSSSSSSSGDHNGRQLQPTQLAQVIVPQPAAGANKLRYRTVYACEDRQLSIDCELGMRINLIRANFGRFSITQCNEQGQLDLSTDCMSPITFRIMKDRCADKQRCSVNATSSIFGDKCPRTRKYLEVHFMCQPAEVDVVDLRQLVVTPKAPSGQLDSSAGASSLQPANSHAAPQPPPADYVNLQPLRGAHQPSFAQPSRVINSEIVNYWGPEPLDASRALEPPALVVLRHKHLENMANPRCYLWDSAAKLWVDRGGQLVDTNLTHTTCAFEFASSYVLVMDHFDPQQQAEPHSQPLAPSPQQQQPQPPPPPPPVDLGPVDPSIFDQQPVPLDQQPSQQLTKISNVQLNQQQQQQAPSYVSSPAVQRANSAASALLGWLLAVFACLALATIAFVASSMRSGAGAALKSLGNFSAFSSNKYKSSSRHHRGPDSSMHTNKDLLVINNSSGHQFLYAPASTTKISSSSSTHILTAAGQPSAQAASRAATLHQIHQQPIYSAATGTLSNLSGAGVQSNNYYYGLMGLGSVFQQQQQQQLQHQFNQQQQQAAAGYHHQANKSTISTESANSTPSSSGVESGSTSVQQQQQQQQANSCLIMGNDYNLFGGGHYGAQLGHQVTLNAHYAASGPQQQQRQLAGVSTRDHIYECVDDDLKSSYASRLLAPMGLSKLDAFSANTLSHQQHQHQQQQQFRTMTLSSRLVQQPQHQQRLFAHPAIVRDHQGAKTNIVCSQLAQVTPQRAQEIGAGRALETTSIFGEQAPICLQEQSAGTKLSTDC